LYGAVYGESELTFVYLEILWYGTIGGHFRCSGVGHGIGKRKAWEVVYAICCTQRQRRPAVLPSSTGLRRLVKHYEAAPRDQSQLLEVEGSRQSGLSRPDDSKVCF